MRTELTGLQVQINFLVLGILPLSQVLFYLYLGLINQLLALVLVGCTLFNDFRFVFVCSTDDTCATFLTFVAAHIQVDMGH